MYEEEKLAVAEAIANFSSSFLRQKMLLLVLLVAQKKTFVYFCGYKP